MKNYFTISEFAKLRNININSLRYYEKIGLLKPARVDPETKYRYYSPEQLSQLDMILLCIDLGIPLKEMFAYVDQRGELQSRALLQEGKRVAQKRMEEIQRGLERIGHSLDYFEENAEYENKTGLYSRHIAARTFLTAAPRKDIRDVDKVEGEFTALFEQAQKENLAPVLPSGILVERLDGAARYQQFFEIVGAGAAGHRVLTVPEGDFLCLQLDFQPGMDLMEIIGEHFPDPNAGPVIVSNMFLSKFRFGSIRTELQQRLPD